MRSESLRVLVVDDQAIILEAVRGMLADAEELEVHLHSDSSTALETALRIRPDVVLLDFNMEPLDGLQLLSQIRAHPDLTDVSVVMLSAEEDPATKVEAFRRGANDYVVKLPSALELHARVRYHANACQSAREREASFQALLESRAALEQRNRLIEEQQEQLKAMNRELTESSLTDALTGLRNRRYLEVHLGQSGSARAGNGTARVGGRGGADEFIFCLMDLDHFKHINDRYGHEAGDAVLIEIARRIGASLESADVALRWGGEEFLIIGSGQGETGAAVLAGRLLAAVGSEPIRLPAGQAVTITCSLGFSPLSWPSRGPEPGLSHDHVLNLADIGLYLSKSGGRNRACGVFPGPDAGIVERIVRLEIDQDRLRSEDGRGVRLLTIHGP
ncbi:MAG TPA: diguanylate cyclase [Xanthomonadaceae bacterium]|jgi:two-component system chemotaxis family response regulator WspR